MHRAKSVSVERSLSSGHHGNGEEEGEDQDVQNDSEYYCMHVYMCMASRVSWSTRKTSTYTCTMQWFYTQCSSLMGCGFLVFVSKIVIAWLGYSQTLDSYHQDRPPAHHTAGLDNKGPGYTLVGRDPRL